MTSRNVGKFTEQLSCPERIIVCFYIDTATEKGCHFTLLLILYSKCGIVHCYNILSAINYGQETQSMHIDPSHIQYSEYIEVYF